jgi:YVTN family beta-propeller protein
MSELDRRLSESLKSVTAARREGRAERAVRVRSEFWRRYRRRRVTRYVPVLAGAGAIALVAVFVASQSGGIFRKPPPVVPAPPAGTYIGVGKDPVGVSVAEGAVWVANAKSGTLTRIDTAGNTVLATITLGGRPSDVAVRGTDLWYADSAEGSVKHLSTRTNQFVGAPISIATQSPIDVDIGSKGTVWATSHDSGALVGIDSSTNQLLNRLFVNTPVELAIAPRSIWTLADDGATLVRFDFATSEPSLQVDIDTTAKTDLAVTTKSVFVAEADGTVLAFDAATGELSASAQAAGTNPEIAVGDGSLWVVSDTGEGIAKLEQLDFADLHEVAKPLRFIGVPTDIALGEGSVWVTDASRNAIVRLEPAG